MPSRRPTFLLALLLSLAPHLRTQPAPPAVTFENLLTEMADRDAAARLPVASYSSVLFSSYDRRSQTPADRPAWFANHDFNNFLRLDETNGLTECVMAETAGPGALVNLWVVGSKNVPDDILRIYLDDRLLVRASIRQLTDGALLAGYPFVTVVPPTAEPQWKARNFNLPLPFARSLKITREGPLKTAGYFYYHAQVRRYAPGTTVETFTTNILARAAAALQQTAADLLATNGISGQPYGFAATLKPGASQKWKIKGPAALRTLTLRLTATNRIQALHATALTIDFDGERTVECPVGYFMGTGAGLHPGGDRFRDVQPDGTLTATWTMPFAKSAVVRLDNHGTQPVQITGQFTAGLWAWDARSLHFHATWRSFGTLDTKQLGAAAVLGRTIDYGLVDLPFVNITGQGRYVGDNIAVLNGGTDWWGEGDEKIYVNGETFPSFFGTGTEDYYGFAWCRPQTFRTPFGGQPAGGGNKKSGYTIDCRVRLLDDVPFTNSFRMTMELLHSQPALINYNAATYFYARPGAKIKQPDPVPAMKRPALESPDEMKMDRPVTDPEELRN